MKSTAPYSEIQLNSKSSELCGLRVYRVYCAIQDKVQIVLCTDCETAFAFQRVLFCPSNLSIKDSREGVLISMPVSEVYAPSCHLQLCASVAELLLPPLLYKLCDIVSVSMWFFRNIFTSNLTWRWHVCKFLYYLGSCKQCCWMYVPLNSQIICIVDAIVVFQTLWIICNEIFLTLLLFLFL